MGSLTDIELPEGQKEEYGDDEKESCQMASLNLNPAWAPIVFQTGTADLR
jgi:hypothetical protein